MEVFTLAVTVAVSTFVMVVTASSLYLFSNKNADKYLFDWTLASVCFFIYGLLSIAITTDNLSNALVPLLPNTFFLAGHAAVLSGVCHLTGKGSVPKFVLTTTIVSIGFHSIPAVSESFILRAYFLFPFLIALYGAGIIALWRDRKSEYSRAYIPLAIVFAMYILQTFLRSFIAVAHDIAMEFLGNDIIQTSGTLATIALFFALTVCFSLTLSWRKEVDLRKKATTDHLTGWLNRTTLESTATSILEECQRRKAQVAFILIDIDNFKSINDQFGHTAGDMAIKHVCRVASEGLRSYDKRFRFGGEEFLIIINDTTQENAVQLSNRIRQSIANQPICIKGNTIPLTVSVGLSLSEPNMLWSTLLDNADQALYIAKNSGRNKVIEHAPDGLILV